MDKNQILSTCKKIYSILVKGVSAPPFAYAIIPHSTSTSEEFYSISSEDIEKQSIMHSGKIILDKIIATYLSASKRSFK